MTVPATRHPMPTGVVGENPVPDAAAGLSAGPGGGHGMVHRFERRAMGSPLRLTVTGAPAAAAARAWEAASVEVELVEQACSRFRPASDLVTLNDHAGDPSGVQADIRLVRALGAADRAHRTTGGRFDVRVLGDLERLGEAVPFPGRSSRAAGPEERPHGDAAGWARRWRPSGIAVDSRTCRVAVERPIDLGGIAKGLAIRWASAAAWQALGHGGPGPVDGAPAGLLLEAGGDLAVRGPAPDGGPWMIGIEDPSGDPDPVAVVALDHGAVCTSSRRIRAWTDPAGRPAHHIIDPATGEPGGQGILAVTVAGDDPAWAEVRAKALFLAGARSIGEQARALDLSAWWVDTSGDLGMTPRARLMTAWTR